MGSVEVKFGINYVPKRKAIGDADKLYTYIDLALPVDVTPFTLKGHVGHTTGKDSIDSGPQGRYLDYSVGAGLSWGMLTSGLS